MASESSKIKILLVDNNEIIRIYFRDIFWIHGLDEKYDLAITETVEKAADIIKDEKTRPNVIFLGLVMPFASSGSLEPTAEAGFSILKMVKSDPELKKIKVIIFSGFDQKKYRDQARKLGADSYLVKHDNVPTELVKFIENLKMK